LSLTSSSKCSLAHIYHSNQCTVPKNEVQCIKTESGYQCISTKQTNVVLLPKPEVETKVQYCVKKRKIYLKYEGTTALYLFCLLNFDPVTMTLYSIIAAQDLFVSLTNTHQKQSVLYKIAKNTLCKMFLV
jgi:hypothetical protein